MNYDPVRIQKLAASDSRLRLLWTEHLTFESRLDTLKTQESLSVAEEIERARLKKLKLVRKDEIVELLKKYDGS